LKRKKEEGRHILQGGGRGKEKMKVERKKID
jgi:hypothetical protein